MGPARDAGNKRHNPVQSICRKLQMIQRMNPPSSAVLLPTKTPSESVGHPHGENAKDNLGATLRVPTEKSQLAANYSSPRGGERFFARPGTMSPSPTWVPGLRSPEKSAGLVRLLHSEDVLQPRRALHWNQSSLTPRIQRERPLVSSARRLFSDSPPESDLLTSTPDSKASRDRSHSRSALWSSVVKKLSLGGGGGKQETDDEDDDRDDPGEATCVSNICEEELLLNIFYACDPEQKGKVAVTVIVDYLRLTTSRATEDSGLEELRNMLDPDKEDIVVDLDTYYAIMKQWIADCRSKWGEDDCQPTAGESSVFKVQESQKAGQRTASKTNATVRSFEALGGDPSKCDLETSDLITCMADLQFNKQKLQEENGKFKLALEAMEEANHKLGEDCEQLRNQMKSFFSSAQQSLTRTKLLKEELEELKTDMNVAEQQKTKIVAQNKQLEKENRSLVLKIQLLQEESISSARDNETLEKKIAELTKEAADHQVQLREYENAVLDRDQRLQEKELKIEELKSINMEYATVIQNLRGEKTKLVEEIEQMQQEILSCGINFPTGGNLGGHGVETSLHRELTLAQSVEIHQQEQKPSPQDLLLNFLEKHEESLQDMLFNKAGILRRTRQQEPGATTELQEETANQAEARSRQGSPHRRGFANRQENDEDGTVIPDGKEPVCLQLKLEEAISAQAINTTLSSAHRISQLKTRGQKNAWGPDPLEWMPGGQKADWTPGSGPAATFCGRLESNPDRQCSADQLTLQPLKCPGLSERPQTGETFPVPATMDHLAPRENSAWSSPLGSSSHSRADPSPVTGYNTSSTESAVTSTDSDSDVLTLTVAPSDLDSQPPEEEGRTPPLSRSPTESRNLANENTPLPASPAEDQAALNVETKTEMKAAEENKEKASTAEETAATPETLTPIKSVDFRQSDNPSPNDKEVEAEFLRLSLGFKCDRFTLEKRVKVEERSRDLAEENLKKEITNCLQLLQSLIPLCEDDNQAQEIIKKLEKSLKFLSQYTARVSGKAEMLGAINQESRTSKAVEVMIQHVENLKRMYAKEHAELEELKQVLIRNERSFGALEDDDDCQTKKRSASLNSKPASLRRVSIATLPRNIGNTGAGLGLAQLPLMSGLEKNERFNRRSSSWRTLGSKPRDSRPSLQRFISSYDWGDSEGEKCQLKDQEESELPAKEATEKTRKLSATEKGKNPAVSSFYNAVCDWAVDLKASFHKANKTVWISVAFIVLFAAFMSFLTGRFFQRLVDAAPEENGCPWPPLQRGLWPYIGVRHRDPPPV
ncbi:inositol 1,4,5-triphosphate receptor associated 2 [Tachyglossus aculeatus]|uniref:inositol 1,4,5-triphosphate receptor associated 2 n=1 Tax=Tachyglossus aculeatus TaxID=9261 RepID=UPI0018F6CE41|nr:inositol 1,4,5-triphosphate receptor associated 2 [Tachyglossus aculeatus]